VLAGEQVGRVEVGEGELDVDVDVVVVVVVVMLVVLLEDELEALDVEVEDEEEELEVTEEVGAEEDVMTCKRRFGDPFTSDILFCAAMFNRTDFTSSGERAVFVLQIWAKTPAT
jgi:hypothetical protein